MRRIRSGDEFFDVVGNRRRRLCLEILQEMDTNTITLDDLAARLAAHEREDDDDGTADPKRRIAVSLYHVHVPKLEHFGLVEFDQRTKTIRYTASPRFEAALKPESHPQ